MDLGSLFSSGRDWLPLRRARFLEEAGQRLAHDVAEPFTVQGRVLLALMLREARTRYGRQRAGYLWALVEPILHITLFYFIFQFTFRYVPLGHSLPMFLATGLATYCGFSNVLNRVQGGFGSNEALLAYPPVTVMDVFLARALLELATWIMVTFIIMGALILPGSNPAPYSVMMMLAAVLLLFCLGFGVGMIVGILSVFMPSIDTLTSIPFRILYFTSGVFFLPEALPPALRDALAWNPVLQGVTLFRMGYYGSYDSHLLDVNYLVIWSTVCMLLALILERATRRALLSRAY